MAVDVRSTVRALLATIEEAIVPLTRDGVTSGSKVFGAAILSKTNLQPLTFATNNERASPLLHGEINCIQKFFTVDFPDACTRPLPGTECVFLATHEPCSLCLSGIAWSGFTEVYYLFTYEDSRDLFSIPHDINILQEVFQVAGSENREQVEQRPLYNKDNRFFRAQSVADLVAQLDEETERQYWTGEIDRVKTLYATLSDTYQENKKLGTVTSSVWQ